jgi:hypothetical protein
MLEVILSVADVQRANSSSLRNCDDYNDLARLARSVSVLDRRSDSKTLARGAAVQVVPPILHSSSSLATLLISLLLPRIFSSKKC